MSRYAITAAPTLVDSDHVGIYERKLCSHRHAIVPVLKNVVPGVGDGSP